MCNCRDRYVCLPCHMDVPANKCNIYRASAPCVIENSCLEDVAEPQAYDLTGDGEWTDLSFSFRYTGTPPEVAADLNMMYRAWSSVPNK